MEKANFEIKIDTTKLAANIVSCSISLGAAIATQDKNKIITAIAPFINIFSCIDIKQKKESLLNKYISNSLKNTTLDVLSLLDYPKTMTKKNKNKVINSLIGYEKTIPVDKNIFNKPGASVISKAYLDNLCCALEMTDYEIDQYDIFQLKKIWPKVFTENSKIEWESNSRYAEELKYENIFGPMQSYLDAFDLEKDYQAKLTSMISEKIFDENCTIDDIFINLNASFTEYSEVFDAFNYLLNWSISDKTGMKILKGDPGSGKSTILKKLAKELIEYGIHVIYVNLFKIPFSAKKECLDTILQKFEELKWYDDLEIMNQNNVVYIFDGLDEIQVNVWENSLELTMQLKLSSLCENQKIILSGRHKIIDYCYDTLSHFSILTILPLSKNNKSNQNEFDIRYEMWKKLKNIFDLKISLNEVIKKENLDELSKNPLLLFLIAWTFKNNPNSINSINNSVQLYRQILQCIYERAYNRKENELAGNYNEYKDYIKILSAIGFSAWKNNSREIPLSIIKDYCLESGIEKQFKKWFEYEQNWGTSKLFLLFFAHENQQEDVSTFEFLHKSFYEYLAIEEIMHNIIYGANKHVINLIYNICNLFENNYVETDFAYYYIEDMLQNDTIKFSKFLKNLKYLIFLFNIKRIDLIFSKENKQNSILSDLKLESIFYKCNSIITNIWKLLEYTLTVLKANEEFELLDSIKLEHLNLYDFSFKIHKLEYAIFEECKFSNIIIPSAKFNYGKWINSQIDDCIFCNSYFSRCYIKNSNYSSVHLESASFAKSNIDSSNFHISYLENTNFSKSKIYNSAFNNCTFIAANFNHAVIKESTFENCNFKNTNFDSVQFINCEFINCIFNNANLSNVKLSNFNLRNELIINLLSTSDLTNADWSNVPIFIKNRLLNY